jgi:hypothetical protein
VASVWLIVSNAVEPGGIETPGGKPARKAFKGEVGSCVLEDNVRG